MAAAAIDSTDSVWHRHWCLGGKDGTRCRRSSIIATPRIQPPWQLQQVVWGRPNDTRTITRLKGGWGDDEADASLDMGGLGRRARMKESSKETERCHLSLENMRKLLCMSHGLGLTDAQIKAKLLEHELWTSYLPYPTSTESDSIIRIWNPKTKFVAEHPIVLTRTTVRTRNTALLSSTTGIFEHLNHRIMTFTNLISSPTGILMIRTNLQPGDLISPTVSRGGHSTSTYESRLKRRRQRPSVPSRDQSSMRILHAAVLGRSSVLTLCNQSHSSWALRRF